ncbi:MAG: elongation factor P [Desulfotomaculaceae bacterium]|nr:elongation factor P [Desulfotomaculaceae bacterium]
MISTNEFRTGLTIELEGDVFQIIDFQHVKPGKGAAFVRSKLRNIRTGSVTEKTFNAGEKIPKARIERREVQYLYNDGKDYNFMDMETFDQIAMNADQLGDVVKYLKENMSIHLLTFQGKSIGVDLPNFVELEVIETSPGIKGDTASGGSKPATLETGAVVQVPFFVNVGDKLQIDTRTGNYIKRA